MLCQTLCSFYSLPSQGAWCSTGAPPSSSQDPSSNPSDRTVAKATKTYMRPPNTARSRIHTRVLTTCYLKKTGEHRNVTTCVSKIQLFKERQKAAATSPSFLKKAAAETRVMYVITNLVCHTHHWTYSLPSQRTLQCSSIAVLVFKLKLQHLLPPHKVATTKLLPQQ